MLPEKGSCRVLTDDRGTTVVIAAITPEAAKLAAAGVSAGDFTLEELCAAIENQIRMMAMPGRISRAG